MSIYLKTGARLYLTDKDIESLVENAEHKARVEFCPVYTDRTLSPRLIDDLLYYAGQP
jgi:hypothetical protein